LSVLKTCELHASIVCAPPQCYLTDRPVGSLYIRTSRRVNNRHAE